MSQNKLLSCNSHALCKKLWTRRTSIAQSICILGHFCFVLKRRASENVDIQMTCYVMCYKVWTIGVVLQRTDVFLLNSVMKLYQPLGKTSSTLES